MEWYPSEDEDKVTLQKCATHPKVETGLSCSKCGQYICPKCMIQTPVGGRCKKCAQMRKPPIFDVTIKHYAIALTVSLLVGGISGVSSSIVLDITGWIFLVPWIVATIVGYLIGKTVSLSVNQKRSPVFGVIVVSGVIVAYSIITINIMDNPNRITLTSYDIVFSLVLLVVSLYIGVSQVR